MTSPSSLEKASTFGLDARLPVTLAWCFGLLVTAIGFWHFSFGFSYPWHSWATAAPLIIFTLCYVSVAAACCAVGARYRAAVLAALLLLWFAAIGGVGAFAAVALIAASSLAVGAVLFGPSWAYRFGVFEGALLSVSTGLALYVGLINYASRAPVNWPIVYLAVFIGGMALGWRHLAFYGGQFQRWLRAGGTSTDWSEYGLFALLVFVLALQGTYAALPEQYYDALAAHLLVVLKMAQNGSWQVDPARFIGSVAPQGANWLFSAGAILAGEAGAKMLNLGLAVLTSGIVAALIGARRGRTVRLLAVGLFASMPLTFTVTASLFSENALAVFCTGMTALLLFSWSDLRTRDALAIAVLMGAAAMVKLQGILFLVPFGLLLTARLASMRDVRWGVGTLLLVGAVAAVIGLEPYLRAFFLTGNPVFPFFNAVFKSPLFPSSANFSNAIYEGKLSWDLPFRWTFESSRFMEAGNGAIGFALLALLPAGLVGSVVSRDRSMLVAAVIGVGYLILLAVFTQYLRYAYYVLPILIVVCAAAVPRTAYKRSPMTLFAALSISFILLNVVCIPAGSRTLQSFDVDVLLAPYRQAAWLRQRVPLRELINVVNAQAGTEATVLIVGQPVGAGLLGRPYYFNWYNPEMTTAFASARTTADLGRLFRRYELTHVIVGPPALPADNLIAAYLANQAATVIELGGATLYKLKYLDGVQLLKNGSFTQGLSSWDASGEMRLLPDGRLLMAPRSTIAQAVAATSGEMVALSAKVLCGMRPSDLRLQINWLSENGSILRTDIKGHGCTQPGVQTFSDVYTPPANTKIAYVYLSSFAGEPLLVEAMSANGR